MFQKMARVKAELQRSVLYFHMYLYLWQSFLFVCDNFKTASWWLLFKLPKQKCRKCLARVESMRLFWIWYVLAWTIQAHLSGNSSVTWYLSLRISAFETNRVNVGTDNYFLELNNLIGPPKSCQKLIKRSHKIVMWKRETLYGKQHCNGRLWIHYKSNQNFSSNKTG